MPSHQFEIDLNGKSSKYRLKSPDWFWILQADQRPNFVPCRLDRHPRDWEVWLQHLVVPGDTKFAIEPRLGPFAVLAPGTL